MPYPIGTALIKTSHLDMNSSLKKFGDSLIREATSLNPLSKARMFAEVAT